MNDISYLHVIFGFVLGIFLSLILLVSFWGIASVNSTVSKAYSKMMCDYIATF